MIAIDYPHKITFILVIFKMFEKIQPKKHEKITQIPVLLYTMYILPAELRIRHLKDA